MFFFSSYLSYLIGTIGIIKLDSNNILCILSSSIITELINSFDGYVDINGHTDNDSVPLALREIIGNNFQFAGARIASLFEHMLNNGLDLKSGRVRTILWGDRVPYEYIDADYFPTIEQIANANNSLYDKADNRRVDFHFHY